jgi:hypothetical protein
MMIYFTEIWTILRTFGEVYDHLVHLVLIWYIFPVLVSRTKKNLATLHYIASIVGCRLERELQRQHLQRHECVLK